MMKMKKKRKMKKKKMNFSNYLHYFILNPIDFSAKSDSLCIPFYQLSLSKIHVVKMVIMTGFPLGCDQIPDTSYKSLNCC